MPKYKVLRTDTGIKYACAACGLIFEGSSAKQEVLDHTRRAVCLDSSCDTPGSGSVRGHTARPQRGQVTGAGYTRPDKSGRWRLGRNAQQKRLIAYFRAIYNLQARDKKYSLETFLQDFEADGSYPKWRGKRSPLQRLAYAYHSLGWEAVKHAAYQLAYDTEVRQRINAYFHHIKDMAGHIDGFLADLEKQALADGDLTGLIIEPDDLNLN